MTTISESTKASFIQWWFSHHIIHIWIWMKLLRLTNVTNLRFPLSTNLLSTNIAGPGTTALFRASVRCGRKLMNIYMMWYEDIYPFSHNHGSVENHPKWKETTVVLEGPIFHFHDYGRKGTLLVHDLRFESYEGYKWISKSSKVQMVDTILGDNSAGGYFWLKQFRWR